MPEKNIPLTAEQFLENLRSVKQWTRGSVRAPHKPLLLLIALARISQDNPQFIPYSEVDKNLSNLLRDWSPPSRVPRPNTLDPFRRLPSDSLWELRDQDGETIKNPRQMERRQLLDDNIVGGFPDEVHQLLKSDSKLFKEAVQTVLTANWPPSLHDAIMTAAGIDESLLETAAASRITENRRDPRFRHIVLNVYERICAVCNFDLRLNDTLLDLQAAHIKWHAFGGPDVATNGIALCGFHHKAFDRGALGLQPLPNSKDGYEIMVSQSLNGISAAREWLLDYNGRQLRKPVDLDQLPQSEFVEWHTDQVFHRPARR